MTTSELKTQEGTTALWTLRSVRLQMALMCAFAMTIHGISRGSIGMALICMVRLPLRSINTWHKHDKQHNETIKFINQSAGAAELSSTSTELAAIEMPEYNTDLQVNWDARFISFIHTSYYMGTIFSVLFAHTASQRIGAKSAIAMSIATTTLSMWLTPLAVYVWPSACVMITLRAVTGFAQGLVVPCALLLIAKWFVEAEKSTAMAIFTTGNQVGIFTSMYVTAELCKVPVLGGWPNAFLAYGLYGVLFLSLWLPFAASRPRQSARISVTELKYIDGVGKRSRAVSAAVRTPYRKLIFSPAILAIAACSFCQSYVLVTIVSYLPEFYKSALGLNLTSNGLWSSLPFAIQMCTKILFAFLADAMKKQGFSSNFVTKLFNGVASFGSAACLLAVSWGNFAPATLITLLCSTLALSSGYVPGYNTSIVCVAPNFTAFVSSFAQGFSILAGAISPLITGLLIKEAEIRAWSIIFQIMVVILFLSGVAFQCFGSANLQSWANTVPKLACSIASKKIELPLISGADVCKEADKNNAEKKQEKKRIHHVSIMDEDGQQMNTRMSGAPELLKNVL